MGCYFLLQGIFPTLESNPCLLSLLYWQVDSFTTYRHLGSLVLASEMGAEVMCVLLSQAPVPHLPNLSLFPVAVIGAMVSFGSSGVTVMGRALSSPHPNHQLTRRAYRMSKE